VLILSFVLDLKTKQVDTFVFLQTEFDGKEFMGFGQQGEFHKLKKSMDFLRQSPKNFFQNLKAKLELMVSSFNIY